MPPTLDTIPPELRIKIYRNLLILPQINLCNPHDTGVLYGCGLPVTGCRVKVEPQFLAILSVCRLFRKEATRILFGENRFIAGYHRKCTNLFFSTIGWGRILELKSMTFRYLNKHNEENGRELIERVPNLKNLELCGFFYLPDDVAAAWKQMQPGQIIPQRNTVHVVFPKMTQAQMDRFAAKATKIGTRITAIANVASKSNSEELPRSYRFQLVPISKKRVKAENLTHTYDLLFLGEVEYHNMVYPDCYSSDASILRSTCSDDGF